jgi:hypothetical protein
MNPTIWAAIIGLVGTIVGASIPWLLGRPTAARNKLYDNVMGSIDKPQPGDAVPRTFDCSGSATGVQPGLSLWLAVEVGGQVWPKESKVLPDKDNKWRVKIFEDGASKTFSVALYVADSKADRRIEKWLEVGQQTGAYTELRGIPGARRIARVDGLRLI